MTRRDGRISTVLSIRYLSTSDGDVGWVACWCFFTGVIFISLSKMGSIYGLTMAVRINTFELRGWKIENASLALLESRRHWRHTRWIPTQLTLSRYRHNYTCSMGIANREWPPWGRWKGGVGWEIVEPVKHKFQTQCTASAITRTRAISLTTFGRLTLPKSSKMSAPQCPNFEACPCNTSHSSLGEGWIPLILSAADFPPEIVGS